MTIKVLVVDDSAFARKVVREVLSAAEGIEVVGIARDGLDALEKITELEPDVVTLDLVMPNLDGLGVLKTLAGRAAPKFVVVSMSDAESEIALEALSVGAFDIMHKPTAMATDRLYELGGELVLKVRAAGAAAARPSRLPTVPGAAVSTPSAVGVRLVVVGTSTGGPQALTELLGQMPANFPAPMAIVLHIPVGYTEGLAKRLNEHSALEVVEAREGLPFEVGRVVLARAGMHLIVSMERGQARAHLDLLPLGTPHRPSVDVLFQSAARAFGPGALGVIMTGMGEDGLKGCREIHAAGGLILTQDEASCVVYGMPGAVAGAGLSSAQVPMHSMAATLARTVTRTQ